MFDTLKVAVQKQFDTMKGYPLFRTQAEPDAMYITYIDTFPAGTNPIYKERTEHDCNCCRAFIRSVGNMVAVIDGKLVSIWDVTNVGTTYQPVADALSALVKASPIDNFFLHDERSNMGADKSVVLEDGRTKTWSHFSIKLPAALISTGIAIGPKLSESRSTKDVLLRGLKEIKLDAIDTVLELIAQNSIYKGDEFKVMVDGFRALKVEFDKLTGELAQDIFCWSKVNTTHASISKIRGTLVGTMLVALSGYTKADGTVVPSEDLEAAIGAYEAKAAPSNYKRTTALVTAKQKEDARKFAEEGGYMSALDRRPAIVTDIPVTETLFVDRATRQLMTSAFDEIVIPEKTKKLDKVEEVPIAKFLADILTTDITSLEVMFENKHGGNLVSLTAPLHADSKNIFKWDNQIAWAYTGDVTDSIRERVKKQGGNVTGDLCCRLAWDNKDDLDFWMIEPNGNKIWFQNKRALSPCGGMLDIDANGGDGNMPNPVENIFYADKRKMKEGVYRLGVNQYNVRERNNIGFTVELDFMGTVYSFNYPKSMRSGENVDVVSFKYSHSKGIEILTSLPSSTSTKEIWGLNTQTFHKVRIAMLSPNFWGDNAVGNKHFFFMLEGCKNPDKVRGFYNEYLHADFDKHRKTFEILGSKMMSDQSDDQLSGLGFSSTQHTDVIVRVTGKFARTIKLIF